MSLTAYSTLHPRLLHLFVPPLQRLPTTLPSSPFFYAATYFSFASLYQFLMAAASLDSILLALIVDHCNKKGWHVAASRLRTEAHEKGLRNLDLPPAFRDGPNSFLTDWYVRFHLVCSVIYSILLTFRTKLCLCCETKLFTDIIFFRFSL